MPRTPPLRVVIPARDPQAQGSTTGPETLLERAEVRVWGYDWPTRSFGAMRVQYRLQFTSRARGGKRSKPRGVVRGLSYASRRRLRELVYSLQPSLLSRLVNRQLVRPASFVTLTWPLEDLPRNEADPAWAKRCLEAWWKQVFRRYPEAWSVWVLEFQGNGNPHFHLLVRWGNPPRNKAGWLKLQAWVSESWAAVCAEGRADPDGAIRTKHVRAGTNARPLDERLTSASLTDYLAKAGRDPRDRPADSAVRELSKAIQKSAGAHQGRWWGALNRKGVTAAVSDHVFDYSHEEAEQLHRLIRAGWQAWADAMGVELEHIPAWRPAMRIEEELARAKRDDLLPHGRGMVDTVTGELFEPGVEGSARSAA